MKIKYLALILTSLFLVGCKTASEHRRDIRDDTGDKVTVGKVQAEIKKGMSGAEVIAILGSPNIVTTDEEIRENWVYDKFATEGVYSTSTGGLSILFLGERPVGAVSKTQRTLTIVIKFDKNKKVRDFAYHSSRF
jgi:outer membrane protein assembly factor BamE (lipoprotein component of BamABCDE complex)